MTKAFDPCSYGRIIFFVEYFGELDMQRREMRNAGECDWEIIREKKIGLAHVWIKLSANNNTRCVAIVTIKDVFFLCFILFHETNGYFIQTH